MYGDEITFIFIFLILLFLCGVAVIISGSIIIKHIRSIKGWYNEHSQNRK